MSAAYDTYDYPAYWIGREYEHFAEIIAIKAFLEKIPKIRSILEIGAGYGRLTPSYAYRAKRIILTDPSKNLLDIAKKSLPKRKIKFLKAKVEDLPEKIPPHSIDLIILVRVLHHIEDIEKMFSVIKKISKRNGYFILEFANKRHLKATIEEFIHGNFTFLLDIFTKDISTSLKKDSLPFNNYHPDRISYLLKKYGFKIVDMRSVSNVRSPFLKRLLPTELLLAIERNLQRPLAKIFFGPSVFILAKNTN